MKRIFLFTMMFFAFLAAGDSVFNAHRAFTYLEKQVEMGPRFPGSQGQIVCRDWLIEKSKFHADTVIVQEFKAYRPDNRQMVDAFNVIARFSPEKSKRVMLSTHWDTRPISDKDFVYYNTPVPGANDGASGTAVLIEIMDQLSKMDLEFGVDIVFWDAEDMGIAGSGEYFCQGSEYYSLNPILPLPQKGILIDMIGDADLLLPVEVNSMKYAPELVNEIWDIAAELGYGQIFQKILGYDVYDDHVPLSTKAGIPTIDIIDFNYRHNGKNIWHTPRDLPAYCSPQSLQVIGDVLLVWLSRQ
ncbi:MAG: M28 family peptidase [Candidatus Marinimicrobia bacterium]|nr:M28 family peptidase [Candidatus Neomarinimicrobiota bacterium]